MNDPEMVLSSTAGRGVVAATVIGSGMAMLDGTVVNIALPRIGEDLDAGLTALQWTVNAYALSLAGLLLLGGSLGDRFGRRRIYVLGVAWFTLASVGCAVAPTAGVLIVMRLLEGVGAALLTPGSLAILEAVFRPRDRAAAVGAWSGFSSIASAIGPVLGGVLVQAAPWGWRLTFLLNLPLAFLAVFFSLRFIPETRDDDADKHHDIPGVVLAAAGLAATVYALTEGPPQHWPAATTGLLALGVVLLVLFVASESRASYPLMPLALFGNRQFSAANVVTFLVYGAMGAALFVLPVQLQRVSGYSPLAAGCALLPLTAVMLVLSAPSGRLATAIGPRVPMSAGPVVAGIGFGLYVRVGPHASYLFDVLPAVLVFALGLTATVAPLTATALAGAPPQQVGVASAINNDVSRIASLLAVAVLPGLAGITPDAYKNPAEFSSGFDHAMLICAGLCIVGGLLSFIFVSGSTRVRHVRRHEHMGERTR